MRTFAVLMIASSAIFAACGDNSNTLQNGGQTAPAGTSTTDPSGANSTGAPSSSSTSSSSDGSAEQDCVDAINQYRATIGAPAYTRWNAEESCADGEAKSDSASGVAHGAFGTCGEFAQDECPGWPGPPTSMIGDCLQAMWAEGPGGGHYDNMSNKSYTMAACGFYTLADGSVWAVQNFK